MPFFAVENLTQQSAKPCCPWEFVATENITDQIRHDKKLRTSWYQNPATRHCFYTTVEGVNPNQRVSKENPPIRLHGFAADFDLPITHERAAEVAATMPVKPAYIEKSLGVGTRLVWTFPRPVVVDTTEFCTYVLQRAAQWLSLDLLPGLDAPQFERIGVLLCCGSWTETGYGPIPEEKLQAFLFDVARQYNFTGVSSVNIPLELVEAGLREKYPAFSWPGEFALESQGPSFWLPDSVSTKSAIAKADGMFTFSAHADKSFYSWSDLLGAEFTKDFFESSIAKATIDIWFDSKHFWRRGKDGHYINCEKEEIQEHLKVNCAVSAKPDKTGVSLMDQVLCHIRSENRIKGSAPFVFRPAGVIDYMGHRYLNTFSRKPIQPSVEPGEFPTLRDWLSKLFHETEIPDEQMLRLLAWWKHAYEGAVYQTPSPGTVLFLMGGVGVGKCLGRGVKVMQASGESCLSEDIKAGDYLMGDDGRPRFVSSVSRGRGHMYRVTSHLGEAWTCNDEHILVVEKCSKSWKTKEILEISVKDFLRLSKSKQRRCQLFTPSGWEQPEKILEYDPYIYGLWLGDGAVAHGGLTTMDKEIKKEWSNYFSEKGFRITTITQQGNKASTYVPVNNIPIKPEFYRRVYGPDKREYWAKRKPRKTIRGCAPNLWRTFCKKSSNQKEKFIYPEYLNSSRAHRLQLLAGLLDSDGHLCRGLNTFEITQKSKKLAEQIAFLARSLGFFVSETGSYKTCQTGGGGFYYRLRISGNTEEIPTRLARKRATRRLQKKRRNVSGFTVTPIGEDDYFGVTIDGNRRFLLADGTVMHNTFLSRYCIGESLGGFFDACGMLVRHSDFNSHRFEVPLWAVDDESVTPNTQTQIDIQQRLKQIVANSDFSYNRKFCVSGMVSWMGRVIITANTDSVSTRILGPMDSSTLSKITILRCADENKFEFPGRQQWPAIVSRELPFLLNWLLAWEPPDFIRRDNRYGYAAWHEASLLDSAYQNSSSGAVKELIYEALVNYFSLHPDATQWAGTSTQLLRMLQSHAPTDFRAFRAEYFDRSLALIEREGLLKITSSTGPVKTRLWTIQKPSEL